MGLNAYNEPVLGSFPEPGGITNALLHIAHSPLWMEAQQPHGTPGFNGMWKGNPRAPLCRALRATFRAPGMAGVSGTANFTSALSWFAPRYEAWKTDPAAATITEADVMAVWHGWWSGNGLLDADEAGGTCDAAGASPRSTVDTPYVLTSTPGSV